MNSLKYVGKFMLMCITMVKVVPNFHQIFQGMVCFKMLETTALEA